VNGELPSRPQQWSNACFELKEGALWHSEHALKRVIVDAPQFFNNSAAVSTDVCFPSNNSPYTEGSRKFLAPFTRAFHAYHKDRHEDACGG
jgi:hypothetical protein